MHPPRVLIVEDDPSRRKLYGRFIASKGYQAVSADSGRDALAKARVLRPQLVLIDAASFAVSGIALFQFLRTDPVTRRIPVILMSGVFMPEGILAAAAESLSDGAIRFKDEFDQLYARIGTSLRGVPAEHILRRAGLSADPVSSEARFDGQLITIGRCRFHLLYALLRCDRAQNIRALLRAVWPGSNNPNLVAVTLKRLRTDLKPYPAIRIESRTTGYLLVVD